MTEIPRGKYRGKPVGTPPADEAQHFVKCPACGGWIDCRDLGAVCLTPAVDSIREANRTLRSAGGRSLRISGQ
jgi:hypothetical protein